MVVFLLSLVLALVLVDFLTTLLTLAERFLLAIFGVSLASSTLASLFFLRIRTATFSALSGFGKSRSATVLISVSISPSSMLITRVA